MKKNLLLISLLLASQASFGQLTQTNEPAAGTSVPMYKMTDVGTTTAANLISVTGSNVTWDYSSVVMEPTATGVIDVIAASGSSYFTNFPTSTKGISQGTAIQFFNSTPTDRTSQGFVFNDPTFGEIIIVFDQDEAIVMPYPFNNGVNHQDDYIGSTSVDMGTGPTPATVVGTIYSKIDGTGTLLLPNSQIANVFRLLTQDTLVIDVSGLYQAEVVRTQMEYYDLSDQDLPVFVDATLSIAGMGEQRDVLSKNYSTAGLASNSIQNVAMFPNPSNGEFTVTGDFTTGLIEVTDIAGKAIYNNTIKAGEKVQLKEANSGVYFVKLTANNQSTVQKITIK